MKATELIVAGDLDEDSLAETFTVCPSLALGARANDLAERLLLDAGKEGFWMTPSSMSASSSDEQRTSRSADSTFCVGRLGSRLGEAVSGPLNPLVRASNMGWGVGLAQVGRRRTVG